MAKKTYTRPKDWKKTIQRSHFDKDKDFTGEDYEKESEVKEKEEKRKKLRKSRFGKLIDKLTGKD